MADKKKIIIIGGGTVSYIASHLALSAPAYGTTARQLFKLCKDQVKHLDISMYLTKMAGGKSMETNEDVKRLVDYIVDRNDTKIVFFNPALVDFDGKFDGRYIHGDKYGTRLDSSRFKYSLNLYPSKKIIKGIREKRKDIFLVGFKQTCGATEDEQYIRGLALCKQSSCNLVLANDTKNRLNMIITPEEARYHVTHNREEVLKNLVEMALLRSHLSFTRSTVVKGDIVPWSSELVPSSLRTIVNYCIDSDAYKPFGGVTVGHFACKLDDNTFLTSIRKTNFNEMEQNGLVKVVTDTPDTVLAYGAKPSVGGQSQRIVFSEHPEYDCIVHFHCPKKVTSQVPTVSQREFECGSHECGKNTSNGLTKFGNLSAVYLDQHGPNIVFNKSIDPQEVINFINDNFVLSEKTGGFVSLGGINKCLDQV